MGFELWTSPLTGYRRHGTRLRDLNDVLGRKIRASAIAEPLKLCSDLAFSEHIAPLLRDLDFDIAGVRTSENSPVLGFVQRTDLTSGRVQDHLQVIDEPRIVAPTTALPVLLDRLSETSFIFVRSKNRITGILTLADLNKPIVRTYFFGLISLLEIHLGYWARTEYPDDEWQVAISKKRLAATIDKQKECLRRGQSLSLFQCLDFGDKKALISKSKKLRQLLSLKSRNKAEDLLSNAESLRNTLAHSQYDLVGGGSWHSLIALVQSIESIISLSDAAVETRALNLASMDLGALW